MVPANSRNRGASPCLITAPLLDDYIRWLTVSAVQDQSVVSTTKRPG